MREDAAVRLRWTGEGQAFEGSTERGVSVAIDGDGRAGSSPVETLLFSLAGCMAADVVDILGKMRVEYEGLELRVAGERASEPPRRFLRLELAFRLQGLDAGDEPKLRRAIDLSRETYCSVLHSLREDLPIETTVSLG